MATDINNDGRMDLFVANDTVQNFLFVNRGPGADGRWNWDEIALQAGVGFSENGRTRSGMGVDAADLDGDGWQDLFVANVDHEMYSVYINNKDESFHDASEKLGVARDTRLMSGWGLKYFDYDNDGAVDLLLANGHPDDMIDSYSMQVKYKEPLLLYHQGENGKLHNVSQDAGPVFQKDFAARGLAVGDYDNDGALDVIIGINGGPPVLLKNNAARREQLAGIETGGGHLQPRRYRRADRLESRGQDESHVEEQRRKLSVLPRSARSAWHRIGRAHRRTGNSLARPKQADREAHQPCSQSLCTHRRGQGPGLREKSAVLFHRMPERSFLSLRPRLLE